MPLAARMGDIVGPGGVISVGIPTVLINGQPAAVVGGLVTPHACCGAPGCPPTHCASTLVQCAPTVLINGIPSTYVGCVTLCGHPIITGAPGVIITG